VTKVVLEIPDCDGCPYKSGFTSWFCSMKRRIIERPSSAPPPVPGWCPIRLKRFGESSKEVLDREWEKAKTVP